MWFYLYHFQVNQMHIPPPQQAVTLSISTGGTNVINDSATPAISAMQQLVMLLDVYSTLHPAGEPSL